MRKIKILIPVYNDWQSVFKLIENINSEASALEVEFSVVIVDDASIENRPELLANLKTSELIFSISLNTDCQSL